MANITVGRYPFLLIPAANPPPPNLFSLSLYSAMLNAQEAWDMAAVTCIRINLAN